MPNNCESRKEKKSGARVEREKKKENEEEKKEIALHKQCTWYHSFDTSNKMNFYSH